MNGRQVVAHRWAYEHFIGPIPDGMGLDHLCHTADKSCRGGRECLHRRCVNPAHLEPVTSVINLHRSRLYHREACPFGHAFTPENTVRYGRKGQEKIYRNCRICMVAGKRARRAKRQAITRDRSAHLDRFVIENEAAIQAQADYLLQHRYS
ncbi:MAG: HNH endonuclease [Dehalococcoidia bacterium]